MHHHSRTPTLLVIAASITVSWIASVAEAQSHRGFRAGAHSQRGGHRMTATTSRPAPRRPAPRPRSSVVPPGGLGSAANVRPGFYQQLSAPRHHGHGHGVPIFVYPSYFPETYYPTAPLYPEPEPEPIEVPAAPAAPIYIVTPPVIAAPPASAPPSSPLPPPAPRSTEPGEVKFSVLPADAKVYLDDDYLGTGAELAALEEAALFSHGVHVLEVTHPDYRPQRLVFGVSDTDPVHVLIDLSVDRIGRRTRVK